VALLLILGLVWQNCQKDTPSNAPSTPGTPQKPTAQTMSGDVGLMLQLIDKKHLLEVAPQVTLTTKKGKSFKVLPKDNGKGMDHAAGDNQYAAMVTLPRGFFIEVVIVSGGLRWKVEAAYCKHSDNIEIELKSKDKARLINTGKCAPPAKVQPPQTQPRNPDMRSPGVTALKPSSAGKTPSTAALPSGKQGSVADSKQGSVDASMSGNSLLSDGSDDTLRQTVRIGLYIWCGSLLGLGIILAGALVILKRKDKADAPPSPDSPEEE